MAVGIESSATFLSVREMTFHKWTGKMSELKLHVWQPPLPILLYTLALMLYAFIC